MMRPGLLGVDDRLLASVWAPHARRLAVVVDGQRTPCERVDLGPGADAGWWSAGIERVPDGTRYWFEVDGRRLADPASRWQPDGVHGPSAVVGTEYDWDDDAWAGVTRHDLITSEIHIGTFTPEGTFAAAAARLVALAEAGFTAVEVMPIAQFPGARNWGYDGVFPFAAQSTYGGPHAFKAFVAEAHRVGLAVVLDVVYNHLGPDGNVLGHYGPYFTDRYRTPWGDALNYDGPGSDSVRAFFIASALQWVGEFHVDGLRLDAVHAIVDPTARPFVAQLADAVHDAAHAASRTVLVIAESDLNDPRVVLPTEQTGLGCDAQWSDDFHHALHVAVTGETDGYYGDFAGLDDLAAAFEHGSVLRGRYSRHRQRTHGRDLLDPTGESVVVFAQNHDQIGNRPVGERLTEQAGPARARLATAAVLLAPFLPLLFQGEEWGAPERFPYFTDHADPVLVEAVRRGRAAEFAHRAGAEVADPQAAATFASAVLDWDRRRHDHHAQTLAWTRALIDLRRRLPALLPLNRGHCRARVVDGDVLTVHRFAIDDDAVAVFGFGAEPRCVAVEAPDRAWACVLDSEVPRFGGAGALRPARVDGPLLVAVPPRSLVVYATARGR